MSLLMAGVLLALGRLLGDRIDNRGLQLLVMVATGAAVYIASLLLFARRFVDQQLEDFRRLLPGAAAKYSGAGA
jgi:hypothetical protein